MVTKLRVVRVMKDGRVVSVVNKGTAMRVVNDREENEEYG